MKKALILTVLTVLACLANAKDLYARPKFLSGDSVVIQGKVYRLWGIKAAPGNWGKIGRLALIQMNSGKEVKFLADGKHPGVLRYGMYDRNGKRQINAALKLIRMGLALYEPSDLPKDEKIHKYYREAQETAKSLKVGMWAFF